VKASPSLPGERFAADMVTGTDIYHRSCYLREKIKKLMEHIFALMLCKDFFSVL